MNARFAASKLQLQLPTDDFRITNPAVATTVPDLERDTREYDLVNVEIDTPADVKTAVLAAHPRDTIVSEYVQNFVERDFKWIIRARIDEVIPESILSREPLSVSLRLTPPQGHWSE